MTATIRSAQADTSADAERATSTILIADDSRTVSRLLARAIRDAGYPVLVADDGHQAVEQALAHAPALVVLDISMPRLDGFQVCRELLSSRQWDPRTPIVFLTGIDKPHLTALGDRLGAFLTKPADPEVLLATIETLLANRHAETRATDGNECERRPVNAARMGAIDHE